MFYHGATPVDYIYFSARLHVMKKRCCSVVADNFVFRLPGNILHYKQAVLEFLFLFLIVSLIKTMLQEYSFQDRHSDKFSASCETERVLYKQE